MNLLDKQYTDLLQDILDNGVKKQDRTGTGTLSVFGRQIRHSFKDGRFPLLTTKKMPFKTITTELLWFLRGDTNIKYLVDNNCHIWDGDAFNNYDKFCIDAKWMEPVKKELNGEVYDMGRKYDKEEFINKIKTNDEFVKKFGDLGPIYGKQWRKWTKPGIKRSKEGIPMGYKIDFIDQIQNLINDLKANPDSRRLMVTAWNPADLDASVLPPCHYGFQVYTRELSANERIAIHASKGYVPNIDPLDYIPERAISLMWNQRSCDTFLGLPFNIASYGLLLEIIAKAVNMVPDELIGNLGDTHLYLNHIEQAKEHIGRELSLEERVDIFNKKKESGDIIVPEFKSIGDMNAWTNKLLDEVIPARTRQPYALPTLKHLKTDDFYKSLSEDLSLLNHLENTDFVVKNYQSHPAIKAPLSN